LKRQEFSILERAQEHTKLRSVLDIRDFRLEAERNTPSACCGNSEGLGNLFI